MKSTSGTMRNLHGSMMIRQLDQAPRVRPLLRRDHNHRHRNKPQGSTIQPKKMPRSSTGGGASSSTHAAFRSGPGTNTSRSSRTRERWELDLQLKTGWRGRNLPLWKYDSMLQKIMRIKNRELRSYDQAEISSFPPSRALTPPHELRDQFDLETILEKIDISRCAFFQHVDWRTTWFPHDQWERLRMVEALPPYHHVHRICQMQRISSDGGLGSVDIGHWRYGRGWKFETSSRNWGARLGSSSLGSLGWIDGMNWGGRWEITNLSSWRTWPIKRDLARGSFTTLRLDSITWVSRPSSIPTSPMSPWRSPRNSWN